MTSTADRLFTEEQQKYVNSVSDSELRSHLLHQVRLRDNMEADRNAFEEKMLEYPSIQKCMYVLIEELKKDKSPGSYYYGLQSNIAIAFYDEFLQQDVVPISNDKLYKISNDAAKRFLDLLIS